MNKAAQDDLDTRLGRIAALGDPIRRALYRFVVAQPEPVGRAQAADAVGIAHHSAKFHLDKLESEGLLDIEYARRPGRSGPGAGRPAKRYRRSAREVAVSLPERRYDIASYVMAEAITTARESDMPVAEAVQQSASALGRDPSRPRTRSPRVRPSADADCCTASATGMSESVAVVIASAMT
jgi:predicted ArsR family transcriptional regulator